MARRGGGGHPGFKAVQQRIAAEENVPMENAGAILAKSSREASPAAKKRNPRLNRVRGKGKKRKGPAMTTAYMGGGNFRSY